VICTWASGAFRAIGREVSARRAGYPSLVTPLGDRAFARTGRSIVAVTAAAWIAGCSLVAFPFDEYDKLTGVDASVPRDGARPDEGPPRSPTPEAPQRAPLTCGAIPKTAGPAATTAWAAVLEWAL
jgi:hypothetical protein